MKLIVGLGNPGNQYKHTRHNIGFMAIDCYLQSLDLEFIVQTKFKSHFLKIDNAIFIKPQTYMNLSGESVTKIVNYFNIKDILVIHDDLDLNFGNIKIKFGGNSGGHNGLKSIDKYITNQYTRLRVGIGHPRNIDDKICVSDYVLQNFNNIELEQLKQIFKITNSAIQSFISNDSLMDLQNKYNTKNIMHG